MVNFGALIPNIDGIRAMSQTIMFLNFWKKGEDSRLESYVQFKRAEFIEMFSELAVWLTLPVN